MAKCGIKRIDDLIDNVAGAEPITEKDTDKEVIAAIQELLIGFNYRLDRFSLKAGPGNIRGKYEKYTKIFVERFRKRHEIEPIKEVIVDRACLIKLLEISQPENPSEKNPISGRIYLSRILNVPFTGIAKCVWATSNYEGDGKFTAVSKPSLNEHDQAGLSYGLVQWTHRSGRLSEIMESYNRVAPTVLSEVFGNENARQMLAHAKLADQALKQDGTSINPNLEFLDEVWRKRFEKLGRIKVFQRAQVDLAIADFTKSLADFRTNHEKSVPPIVKSERGVAFMLDLINQRPDWLRTVYKVVHPTVATEGDLLKKMRDNIPFKERRDFFLKTEYLSDQAFVAG